MGKIKSVLLRCLPPRLQRQLKRLYYPLMLKKFTEKSWPPSVAARQFVKAGDLVVDVGANIGYVTLLLSRMVGEEGAVYSIEPVPETFDLLSRNVSKLNLTNVRLVNSAVSSHAGKAVMTIPRYASGGENFYESHLTDTHKQDDERTVEVSLVTLDEVLADVIDRIAFVKIDVEGHELSVLQGARRLVEASRPAFVIEIADNPNTPGARTQQVFAWMKNLGYQPFIYREGKLLPWEEGSTAVDCFFLTSERTRLLRGKGVIVGQEDHGN